MQWHEWVVLIAGSTGFASRAVRPPNLHITPDIGAISSCRKCDRFLVVGRFSQRRRQVLPAVNNATHRFFYRSFLDSNFK